MLADLMHKSVHAIEWAVAGLLVIIAGLGLLDLVVEIVENASGRIYLRPEAIFGILDAVLVIFIVIELFNIALAYLERRSVVPVVMEAALVAVVRKLVVFELDASSLPKAGALAMLIFAVGTTWFLLRRADASREVEDARH